MELELREELKAFAENMERTLLRNDSKKHKTWKSTPIQELYDGIQRNLTEIQMNLSNGASQQALEPVIKNCVDIANYAMMISDNITRIKKKYDEVDELWGD